MTETKTVLSAGIKNLQRYVIREFPGCKYESVV